MNRRPSVAQSARGPHERRRRTDLSASSSPQTYPRNLILSRGRWALSLAPSVRIAGTDARRLAAVPRIVRTVGGRHMHGISLDAAEPGTGRSATSGVRRQRAAAAGAAVALLAVGGAVALLAVGGAVAQEATETTREANAAVLETL